MNSQNSSTSDDEDYLIFRINGEIYAKFNGTMWFVVSNIDCPNAIAIAQVFMNYILWFFSTIESDIPDNLNGIQNWTSNSTLDFEENETSSGNSGQNTFRLPGGTVCSDQYHNLYANLTFKTILCILCLLMLFGNGTIVLLGFFDKSFQSPLLTTIQSFSGFSVVNGLIEWASFVFPCTAGSVGTEIYCLIRIIFISFINTMLYVHLIILSIIRIYVTLYPLHAMAKLTKKRFQCYLLLTNLFVLLFMIVYNYFFSSCLKSIPMPTSKSNINFVFLLGLVSLTCLMSVTSMIISLVQSRRSASKLQLSSYRQQSRVASVLIIMFLFISVPTQFFFYLVVAECSDSLVMTIVGGCTSFLRLLFLTINPIILCLRLETVRQKISYFFIQNICVCLQKKSM